MKAHRLFLTAAGIVLVSMIAMISAARTLNPALAWRHLVYILCGMAIFWGVARTSYRRWTDVAILVYLLALVTLVMVEVAGATRLGATRWLSLFGLSIQPSELAKLSTTLLLAQYLAGQPVPLSWRALAISLGLAGLPALLIFVQPDLGSASVLAAIWLGMVWVAGISPRALTVLGTGFAACLPVAWHVLKGYQRDRLMAFIDPHADPLGTGYTIIQSTIAIGSGQWWGRGWFSGTQNQLSFLPERHSDFIFSVIGEEWGLLGCLALIGAFGALLVDISRVALETSDPQGRLLAAGMFSWLAYQSFVNIGMVMGLLPVVGVPLPFVSFGGSSMVTLWLGLGLLEGIRRSERS